MKTFVTDRLTHTSPRRSNGRYWKNDVTLFYRSQIYQGMVNFSIFLWSLSSGRVNRRLDNNVFCINLETGACMMMSSNCNLITILILIYLKRSLEGLFNFSVLEKLFENRLFTQGDGPSRAISPESDFYHKYGFGQIDPTIMSNQTYSRLT